MRSFSSLSTGGKAVGVTGGQWRAGWSDLPGAHKVSRKIPNYECANESFLKNVLLSGELLSLVVRSARARHSAAAACAHKKKKIRSVFVCLRRQNTSKQSVEQEKWLRLRMAFPICSFILGGVGGRWGLACHVNQE